MNTIDDFSNWRAMGETSDGYLYLICIGRSSAQLKENYVESYKNGILDHIKEKTIKIRFEKWNGQYDYGKWVTYFTSASPERKAKRQRQYQDNYLN